MKRTLLMAAIAMLIATSAQGDSILFLLGVGGSGGTPIAACGTGVIDLNAPGCSIAIPLGLVP